MQLINNKIKLKKKKTKVQWSLPPKETIYKNFHQALVTNNNKLMLKSRIK